jgi:hypothetical protein
MAKKILKKAQFGREVTKSSYKVPTSDGGYEKINSRVVTNKEGDLVKTRSKSTVYTPTGNSNGKSSEYSAGNTTVSKYKFSPESSTPTSKSTRRGIIPAKTGGTTKKKK